MSSFLGLVLRWKASVYKIVWRELIVFSVAFYALSFMYRYALRTRESKARFEEICQYAQTYRSHLPISFILGFYVTVIYNRWWSQFNAIPRPDAIAANVAAHIQGTDEQSRLLRRTMVRYVNLAATLTYCAISTSVKKRFPTQKHLVRAGLLMESEKEMLNSVQSDHPKYWIPCVWYINLIRKADDDNKISNAPGMKTLIDELNKFREKCDALYSFDWIEVPIVYTQVVTLAVFSYFVASLFSHQFLSDQSEYEFFLIDLYVPVTVMLELVFYFGWLKVAEKIMDPFGDDEHDFDMNVIVDRNWQVSYLTVDTMYQLKIPLVKDPHFHLSTVVGLPHTKASLNMPMSKGSSPWLGSANHVRLTNNEMETDGVGEHQNESGICSCFKRQTDETVIIESEVTQVKDAFDNFLAASTPGEDPSSVVLNSLQPSSLNNIQKQQPGSLNSLQAGSLTSSQAGSMLEKRKRGSGHGVARTPSLSAAEDCSPHQRYSTQRSDPSEQRHNGHHNEHQSVKRLSSHGDKRYSSHGDSHSEQKRHSSHSDHGGEQRHGSQSDHGEREQRHSSQSDHGEHQQRKNNGGESDGERSLRPKSESKTRGKSPRHVSHSHEGTVYTQNVKGGRTRSSASSHHRPRSDRNSNYPRS